MLDKIKENIKENITQIENRNDIDENQKSEKIIHIFSSICAAVAVQPIPFADIAILTPIQLYMGERISSVRGLKINEQERTKTLKDIVLTLGLGVTAQQIALGAYKVGLPFLAGFTTIPLVYALTYGIGKVMDRYVKEKIKGNTLTKEQMMQTFKEERKKGKKKAKENKEEIIKKSKEFK